MTRAEREAFLTAVRVGILAIEQPGQGPLALPVWYGYEPGGDLWFATGSTSRKLELLRAAGRASLCAQTERPPYAYVSVEGPLTFASADPITHLRALAHRYLGAELGDRYLAGGGADAGDSVLVRLRPERWRTTDYAKMTTDGGGAAP